MNKPRYSARPRYGWLRAGGRDQGMHMRDPRYNNVFRVTLYEHSIVTLSHTARTASTMRASTNRGVKKVSGTLNKGAYKTYKYHVFFYTPLNRCIRGRGAVCPQQPLMNNLLPCVTQWRRKKHVLCVKRRSVLHPHHRALDGPALLGVTMHR